MTGEGRGARGDGRYEGCSIFTNHAYHPGIRRGLYCRPSPLAPRPSVFASTYAAYYTDRRAPLYRRRATTSGKRRSFAPEDAALSARDVAGAAYSRTDVASATSAVELGKHDR